MVTFNTALEIPEGLVFNSKTFDLGFRQQLSPGGQGYVQTLERTSAAWYAEYSTPPLRDDRYDATVSFLYQLEGSMQTFLAYDPRRPMPRAYQSQSLLSDPWTQTGQASAQVSSASFANSTLTLSLMENGAIVTAGDYISFKVGKVWYLHRVTIGGVAALNALTVTVMPRPTVTAGLPVPIRYRKAVAQMKIIGGIKENDTVDSLPTFSFKAFQFMDRST